VQMTRVVKFAPWCGTTVEAGVAQSVNLMLTSRNRWEIAQT
jgi:hypothetical protein